MSEVFSSILLTNYSSAVGININNVFNQNSDILARETHS